MTLILKIVLLQIFLRIAEMITWNKHMNELFLHWHIDTEHLLTASVKITLYVIIYIIYYNEV